MRWEPKQRWPDFSDRWKERQWLIIEFWRELQRSGDSGATSWEVLDSIANRVTEALMQEPPDLNRAESLTARALLLIEGFIEI